MLGECSGRDLEIYFEMCGSGFLAASHGYWIGDTYDSYSSGPPICLTAFRPGRALGGSWAGLQGFWDRKDYIGDQ